MAAATETAAEKETAAENLYEGMFLLDSGKFATNPDEVTEHLMGLLDKAGATVVAHRPWLDGRLAYEIDGKRKGLHYLVYFRMPGGGVTILNRSCQLSEFVMRHLVINHEERLFDAMVNALDSSGGSEEEAEESSPKAEAAKTEGDKDKVKDKDDGGDE